MTNRCFGAARLRSRVLCHRVAAVTLVTGVLLPAFPPSVEAQSLPAPGDWTVPRTGWGVPDLQGIWTNATLTPIERPDSLSGKTVLTAEEAVELETRSTERRAASDRFIPGEVGAYNQFWMDGGKNVTGDRRTSLIVDPPDGKIPWAPDGRRRLEIDLTKYGVGPFDSWEDADTGERCLTDGLPLVPLQGYNMNYHILQSPGWVAILNEMFHEYRLIPVDGRAHVPSEIGQLLGDARGWWDGDTLVVETTNFADKGHFLWRATWRAARLSLHLVERFTRIDDETIDYAFTMTDPTMFTRPWTARVPMTTNQTSRGVTSGPMFEYACHEGNYGLLNIMRGARAGPK
ncbi:MAG: hypothetical protein DSY84_06970 [Candidatus Neomarinimicrobiota bacterium]|jgi:hypothetical protein|nr:MAG: hypothetical protein DSY84_06970 [Candidatus Neomarinimicrobiota bacterium]